MLPNPLYYYNARGNGLMLGINDKGKLTLTLQFFGRETETLTFPRRPGNLIKALEKLEKKPKLDTQYPYKTFGLWGNTYLSKYKTNPLPYWVIFNAKGGTASYQFAKSEYMEFLHVLRGFYNK